MIKCVQAWHVQKRFEAPAELAVVLNGSVYGLAAPLVAKVAQLEEWRMNRNAGCHFAEQ